LNWTLPMDKCEGHLQEERFERLLAAYDEALASGLEPPQIPDDALTPEFLQRLLRAQAVLRRLEKVQPRTQTSPTLPDNGESASRGDSLPGHLFSQIGRFQVIRQLGHGANGHVLLAFDPLIRREVALKIPHSEALFSSASRRRFLREVSAASCLTHPNLVRVLDSGEVEGICYIESEYVPGPTLAAWLHEWKTPAPPRVAAEIVRSLADAVQYMHGQGVIHRDIKPSNVLLKTNEEGTTGRRPAESGTARDRENMGREPTLNTSLSTPVPVSAFNSTPGSDPAPVTPLLTDFGLALFSEAAGQVTESGAVQGTPAYMAPEQAVGNRAAICPQTDVYALGAVLYELLTKRPPFQAKATLETLRQVTGEEPARPRRFVPELPTALQTICLKCLEKETAQRYPSAGALAEDLNHWLTGAPIKARPTTLAERLVRWCRRNRLVAALALTANGLLIAGVIGLSIALALIHSKQTELEHERDTANEQRRIAIENEKLTRRSSYPMAMKLAEGFWQQGDTERLRYWLEKFSPAEGDEDIRDFVWHYLHGLARRQPHTLWIGRSHDGGVYSVAFSPDDKLLASAGHDGVIRLWEPTTGKELPPLGKHAYEVNEIAFTPDGRWLVSVSDDWTAKIWDVAGRRLVASFKGHLGDVNCLAISENGKLLATGGDDRTIWIWDLESRRPLRHFGFYPGPLKYLSFFHERDWLTYCCDYKHAFGIIDATTGKPGPWKLSFPGDLWAATVSKGLLLAGFDNGEIRASRFPDNNAPDQTMHGHTSRVRAFALSNSGGMLASGAQDNTVRLWQPLAGAPNGVLRGHTGQVMSVAFSRSEELLASAGRDSTIRVWRLHRPSHNRGERPYPPFQSSIISPNGRFSACMRNDLRLCFIDDRAGLRKFRDIATGDEVPVAISSDGNTIALVNPNNRIRLVDTGSHECRCSLSGYGNHGTFSMDGRRFAYAMFDGTSRVVDLITGHVSLIPKLNQFVGALAFSEDGNTLALGLGDGSIAFWDLERGECRRIHHRVHPDSIGALTYSKDGRLATGGADGMVRLWTEHGDKESGAFAMGSRIKALAFSRDSGTLAVGVDNRVTLWHTSTVAPMFELPIAQQSTLRRLVFSSEGNVLISYSSLPRRDVIESWSD
jgi:eukaryotic-like serine/threonine-protein kinase